MTDSEPNTDPCGTPLAKSLQSEKLPSTTTCSNPQANLVSNWLALPESHVI